MNKSNYVLEKTERAICPLCDEKDIVLLCHKKDVLRHPAFYICRTEGCGYIGEVGKGPVEY